ncbi:MAG: hypothetical protein J07HQX50_02431 [Haloquadratum sp. J07HQX50]|nr:MAG: hypothetical protein J07HQX50_02431 [Haloquadratum sp. J07HQX50]
MLTCVLHVEREQTSRAGKYVLGCLNRVCLFPVVTSEQITDTAHLHRHIAKGINQMQV